MIKSHTMVILDPLGHLTGGILRYLNIYIIYAAFGKEKFPMPSCYLANFHRIPFDAICTIFLSGLLHQRIFYLDALHMPDMTFSIMLSSMQSITYTNNI